MSLLGGEESLVEQLKKRLEDLYTAEEIAGILEKSFGEKKVDVFIANNCWMNTFEAGCALMDQVNVYAAPQTIVPFAGIDYEKLFAALEENPNILPKDLAANITENYILKYRSKNKLAEKFEQERSYIEVDELSISVNSLPKYNLIIPCVKKLGKYLSDSLKNDKPEFTKKIDIARSFCGDLTHQGYYIDFTNFLCELLKGFQGSDPGTLKDIYYEFFDAKTKSQLSVLNPGRLFNFMPEYFYSMSPQMFSIYFPLRTGRTELQNTFIKDAYFKTSIKEKCPEWINFLSAYLDIPLNGNPN
jgi:hypothetical protein